MNEPVSHAREHAKRLKPRVPETQNTPEGQRGRVPGEFSILALQAQAGNAAVQRVLQRRHAIQREGDTIYMDESGVGHKEPSKTKTHGVFYMDEHGVGHKEPSKTKNHGTFFMDEHGVGHKEPDKTPARTTPFFMDEKGVGHDAPDKVRSSVKKALRAIQQVHDAGMAEATKVTDGMAPWAARLNEAKLKSAAALTALNTGAGFWQVEAADSGQNAARQAEAADTAAAAAKKAHDDTVAESVGVKAAAKKINDWAGNFAQNRNQFGKDKARWLRYDSPMTTSAVNKIQELLDNQGRASLNALNLAGTVDAELAKFKKESDDAAVAAKKAWSPLAVGGGTTFTIVGILQQKLNATRANGANRTSISAFFDAATENLLTAYQAAKGINGASKAGLATWLALDADAPSIVVNGQLTVKAKEEATGSTPFDGNRHPMVSFGKTGNAVKELQQRLNNWRAAQPGPKPPFKPLKVDGIFGFLTNSATKKFQASVNIQANGNVGKLTWGELDKAPGGITFGAQSFYSEEVVEGATAGGTSAFDWEVKNNKVTITVRIKFTGASSHPMVNTWLDDIRSVWNNYKAVELGANPPRQYDIEFVPKKSSSAPHKVKVGKPTKKNPDPRSDTDNWYVNDTRRGLAPHEFGHLVGLDDEYNRPEESYVKTTGLEPAVAQTRAADGTGSRTVADEINAILTGNPTLTSDQKLGLVADKLDTHGIVTGAFARLVAQRYQAAYGFNGAADISQFFYQYNNNDWTSNLTRATEPFTVSNGSLMGEMTSNLARGQDLTTVAPHEHPVQPRHVQSFANLLELVFPGTKWKSERR